MSKLARWSSDDRDDVQAMIEGNYVAHNKLKARFQEVIEAYKFDGRADLLAKMAERFNQAERDWFLVSETPFDFPEDIFR